MEELRKHTKNRRAFKIAYFILIIILSSITLFIYVRINSVYKQTVVSQIQDIQLVLARSEAKSIEGYLREQVQLIQYIDSLDAIKSLDAVHTRQAFQEVMDDSDSPFIGIARIDNNGVTKVSVNRTGSKESEGMNFSDRQYFEWAKNPVNKDKVQITQPFLARTNPVKGKYVIGIVNPTYFNNNFTGLSIIVISLNEFNKLFMDPIKINSSTRSLLSDQDGKIIAGDSSLIDTNFIEYAQKEKWPGWLNFINGVKNAMQTKSGKMQLSFKDQSDNKLYNFLISYQVININNSDYFVIIYNTDDIVKYYLGPTWSYQIIGLLIVIVFTLMASLSFIIIDNLSRMDGFYRGYTHALNNIKKSKPA